MTIQIDIEKDRNLLIKALDDLNNFQTDQFQGLTTKRPYQHAAQSLGSPAPYEYSDGGQNNVTNGVYTIPITYEL